MKELDTKSKAFLDAVKQCVDFASLTPNTESGGYIWEAETDGFEVEAFPNEAINPSERYAVNPGRLVARLSEGLEPVAFWHSHPQGMNVYPSEIDQNQIKISAEPWLIVGANNYDHAYFCESTLDFSGDFFNGSFASDGYLVERIRLDTLARGKPNHPASTDKPRRN